MHFQGVEMSLIQRIMQVAIYFSTGLLLFLFCLEVPLDPSKIPDNVKATFLAIPPVMQGQEVILGLEITYPGMTRQITVVFGDGLRDTIVESTDKSRTLDTIFIAQIWSTPGKKSLKAEIERSDGVKIPATYDIEVFPKPLTITFTEKPEFRTIEVGKTDTIVYSAITNPSGGNISYSILSPPGKDTAQCTFITQDSSVMVLCTPATRATFTVGVIAQSGIVKDTARTLCSSFTRPSIALKSSITGNHTLGQIDTLKFYIAARATDAATLSLIQTGSYASSEATITSINKDSLTIIFKPDSIKNYVFTFTISSIYGTDTVLFTRPVIDKKFWNHPSVQLNVNEGISVSHQLSQYMIDTLAKGITLTADGKLISGNALTIVPGYGSAVKDTIIVSANKPGGSIEHFTIFLTVTPTDSIKPQIVCISPTGSQYKTGSNTITCKFKLTDNHAGIGTVKFTLNNTIVSDTSRSDSMYQCTVKNLIHGIPAQLKVIATDKSMRKNKDSLSISLTYDSTISDADPPVITQKSGPSSGTRIDTSSVALVFTITDKSGVENVTATLNGSSISNISSSGNDYILLTTLPKYHKNTIIVYVRDKSAQKNIDSMAVVLYYNTKPSTVQLVAPLDEAKGIPRLPVFSWKGGIDADKDTVYYKVHYGQTKTSLISTTREIVSAQTCTTTTNLAATKQYYWKVVAYTKGMFPDSIQSSIQSFTTVDTVPPVLTLLGKDTTIYVGNVWTDPGYRCSDGIDGDLKAVVSSPIISGAAVPDSETVYTLTYTATDNGGNKTTAIRKVTVLASLGLFSKYNFTGGSLADSSGKNRTATKTGTGVTLTADRFSQSNNAYLFSGTAGNYITYNSISGFPTGNVPKTISGWIKTSMDSSMQSFFGFGTAKSQYNFQVALDTLNKIRVNGWSTNYDWTTPVTGAVICDNKWHHIAVTYDTTTTILYIDAVVKGKTTTIKYLTEASTGKITIGNETDLVGWPVNGAIDDVRIYSRALTAGQIKALYTAK